MTRSVEAILESFDKLPDSEKRELAAEIMKRSISFDFPELQEDSLIVLADQVFLELDKNESIYE